MLRPSSRTWTRIVCTPVLANVIVGPNVPYPLSAHPQPDKPQFVQSSMLTVVADIVPIRYKGAPLASTASENWTNTESFAQLFLDAFPRIHNRYGRPAKALNENSK